MPIPRLRTPAFGSLEAGSLGPKGTLSSGPRLSIERESDPRRTQLSPVPLQSLHLPLSSASAVAAAGE